MENPSDEVLNAFELIFRALFDPEEGKKKVAPLVTERFDCSIKQEGNPRPTQVATDITITVLVLNR